MLIENQVYKENIYINLKSKIQLNEQMNTSTFFVLGHMFYVQWKYLVVGNMKSSGI